MNRSRDQRDRGKIIVDFHYQGFLHVARGILAAIQGGVLMLQATGRLGYLEDGLDVAMIPLGARRQAAAV